jgi:hypothetical protein
MQYDQKQGNSPRRVDSCPRSRKAIPALPVMPFLECIRYVFGLRQLFTESLVSALENPPRIGPVETP